MGKFLPIVPFIFLLPFLDYVHTQSTEVTFSLTDSTTSYQHCSDFDMDGMPGSCMGSIGQTDLYPSSGTSLKNVAGGCGSNHYLYTLFDEGGANDDTIYRRELPLSTANEATQILSSGFSDVTSFDICCDNLYFSNGDKIYVQNLDVSKNTITKLIFTTQYPVIQAVEVSCFENEYFIFYTVSTIGIFRIDMEGGSHLQIIFYNGLFVTDVDYNSNVGYFGIGFGSNLFMYDFRTDLATANGFLGSWLTRLEGPVTAVSVGSRNGAPVVLSSWDTTPAEGQLQFSTDVSTTVTVTSVSLVADDIFLCVDEVDCSAGCSACPCVVPRKLGRCCAGLCHPVNTDDIITPPYTCDCRPNAVLTTEECTLLNDRPTTPEDCPLDLIGAVKCQYTHRTEPFYLYAISSFSSTSIRSVDNKGKEIPIHKRKGFTLSTSSLFTSAYRFEPASFGNGNRYGTYCMQTSTIASGLGGADMDSMQVVVQERNKGIISKFLTQSADVGSSICLRVFVNRPCDVRRTRWMLNGNLLSKFNGKSKIVLDPVTRRDFGIYEVYFSGRLKSNRRAIFRLIQSMATDAITCTSGVPSYTGSYCICPPGKTGELCERTCPKGSFGTPFGLCEHTCADIFGDDCDDCRGILFCLQDPLGCQCYPGFKLPSCSPCMRGFYGYNCMEKCDCGGDPCDAYDGTCL